MEVPARPVLDAVAESDSNHLGDAIASAVIDAIDDAISESINPDLYAYRLTIPHG